MKWIGFLLITGLSHGGNYVFGSLPRYCYSLIWLTSISLALGMGCFNNPPAKISDQKATAKTDPTGKDQDKDIHAETPAVDHSKPEPFLKDWTEPSGILMLTGEQHGYLEPCGCSLTQSGGVSRRADLVNQIKAKNWPIAQIDLGGTLKRSRRQDQIKYEMIREALHKIGYQLMGLGTEEVAMGTDFLFSQVPDATVPDVKLPYVCANLAFYGVEDLPSPLRFKIVEVGKLKIGVTSIFGEDYFKQLFASNPPPAEVLKFIPPADALKKVLEQLKSANPNFLVLLSHAPKEETKKLIAQFPEFNIVQTAGGKEDPHISSQPELIGNTYLWETGYKGKKVGLVGFYPKAEPGKQFKFELVDLDKYRFKRTPEMEEIMRYYQERLKNEKLVENEQPIPHPDNTTYVGAKVCGDCHTRAYLKWRSSKHAKALEALEKGHPVKPGESKEHSEYDQAEWINRIYDPECLSCHVTGWNPQEVFRYESGYVNKETTPHLAGQQCENCHGPGAKHSELEYAWEKERKKSPERDEQRKKMHLEVATAETMVCIKCHDPDNSPTFNFKKYWEEVKHPWKD